MSTESELRQKAEDLRALADDIEDVLDAAVNAADTEEWQCPNADDVLGQLTTYQTSAQNAAGHLRDEADAADTAAENKGDDGEGG